MTLDPASISALAAIFGSLTGALASSLSTWITQRHQDRRDLLAKRIFHREQLYSDFISESARAIAEAIQHSFQHPNKLIPTYALVSRIRLSSSKEVLTSAERVIQHIINTYSEPNLTPTKCSPEWPCARILCASSAISARLNLRRCKSNLDNAPSTESRIPLTLPHLTSLSTLSTSSSPHQA